MFAARPHICAHSHHHSHQSPVVHQIHRFHSRFIIANQTCIYYTFTWAPSCHVLFESTSDLVYTFARAGASIWKCVVSEAPRSAARLALCTAIITYIYAYWPDRKMAAGHSCSHYPQTAHRRRRRRRAWLKANDDYDDINENRLFLGWPTRKFAFKTICLLKVRALTSLPCAYTAYKHRE